MATTRATRRRGQQRLPQRIPDLNPDIFLEVIANLVQDNARGTIAALNRSSQLLKELTDSSQHRTIGFTVDGKASEAGEKERLRARLRAKSAERTA